MSKNVFYTIFVVRYTITGSRETGSKVRQYEHYFTFPKTLFHKAFCFARIKRKNIGTLFKNLPILLKNLPKLFFGSGTVAVILLSFIPWPSRLVPLFEGYCGRNAS